MKKTSIFPDRSQELLALFEKAGKFIKADRVPIDCQKGSSGHVRYHGNGEILRKPFGFKNSVDGVKHLNDQVNRSAGTVIFSTDHVFVRWRFAVNPYAENFANTIRSKRLVGGQRQRPRFLKAATLNLGCPMHGLSALWMN